MSGLRKLEVPLSRTFSQTPAIRTDWDINSKCRIRAAMLPKLATLSLPGRIRFKSILKSNFNVLPLSWPHISAILRRFPGERL